MSTNITVVIIMLLGFIALNLIAVKLYHKPQKDMETYAVGNRKMPWFFVCFTYMAGWYVGSTYTGWVGNSVDLGLFAQYLAIYGLAVVAVCEIVSLFIVGFDIGFTVFLLAGFAAALVNFWLLAFFLQKMLDSGNAGFSTISFVIRILIYCAVFFIAVKQGHTPSWVGCLAGILAPKVPLYYFNAVKPDFNTKRKVRPEVQAMYEQEDKEKDDEY